MIRNPYIYTLSLARLLHRLDLLRQRRPGRAPRAWTSCRSIWARRWRPAVRLPAAEDAAHHQGATASPRSPTSSPPATARARSWLAWSRSWRSSGSIPYIALQLKAVAASVTVLLGGGRCRPTPSPAPTRRCSCRCCWPRSAILFGTRHIDATEHHEGMVAGGGLREHRQARDLPDRRRLRHLRPVRRHGDVFRRARRLPASAAPLTDRRAAGRLCRLVPAHRSSSGARVPVPAAPVPGGGDRERRRGHLRTGDLAAARSICWHQPVRAADRARPACCSAGGSTPTCSCCRCRSRRASGWLALIAFLGGLSAATAMIIVATVALSTMISQRPDHAGAAAPARSCGLTEQPRPVRAAAADPPRRHPGLLLLGYAFFRDRRRVATRWPASA